MSVTEREIYERSLITGFVPTGEQLNSTTAVGLPRDSASLVQTPTVITTDTITTHDRFGHQMTGVPITVPSVTITQEIVNPDDIANTGKKLLTYVIIGIIALVIARAVFK